MASLPLPDSRLQRRRLTHGLLALPRDHRLRARRSMSRSFLGRLQAEALAMVGSFAKTGCAARETHALQTTHI